MKATLFAVVLSLFVVSFSAVAEVDGVSETPPPVEQIPSKINLNKADVQTLTQSVKGIGKKRAEAIVAHREKNGAFKSVGALAEIRGLGKSFVNSHLDQLQSVFAVE